MSRQEERQDAMVKITALQASRGSLVQRKMEIQNDLSRLTAEVRGRHVNSSRYSQVCDAQEDLKHELCGIEKQLSGVMAEIRELSLIVGAPKEETPIPVGLIAELVSLRDEYEAFAADGTRVSSMRTMAAEFNLKLSRIIRKN